VVSTSHSFAHQSPHHPHPHPHPHPYNHKYSMANKDLIDRVKQGLLTIFHALNMLMSPDSYESFNNNNSTTTTINNPITLATSTSELPKSNKIRRRKYIRNNQVKKDSNIKESILAHKKYQTNAMEMESNTKVETDIRNI